MTKSFKTLLLRPVKVSFRKNANFSNHDFLADNRIGIEELHQIMVTARALAISRGVCSPTTELLEEARSMMKKIADRT